MIKIDVVCSYWKYDKGALLQCMVVFLVCVFLDPTYAIVAAYLMGLWREARSFSLNPAAESSDLPSLLPVRDDCAEATKGVASYRPLGHWTYTNRMLHGKRVCALRKAHAAVNLDLSATHLIDLDGYDSIKPLLEDATGLGTVSITGLHPAHTASFRRFAWFNEAEAAGRVHGTDGYPVDAKSDTRVEWV